MSSIDTAFRMLPDLARGSIGNITPLVTFETDPTTNKTSAIYKRELLTGLPYNELAEKYLSRGFVHIIAVVRAEPEESLLSVFDAHLFKYPTAQLQKVCYFEVDRDSSSLLQEIDAKDPQKELRLNLVNYFLNANSLEIDPIERGEAQYMIGSLYLTGKGIPQNFEKAFKYNRLGSDEGNLAAKYNLSFCYLAGTGVSKDPVEGARILQQSADQGDALAQCSLGTCYAHGMGVPKDSNKAFENYLLAANQGHPGGQNNLGICYKKGIGVEADPKKAFENFKLSADQGDAVAQSNLGACYQMGIGVEIDPAKAFEYFKLSADQRNAEGQNNLGICYQMGIGVEKDVIKANEYYNKSAKQGNQEAKNNYENLTYGISSRKMPMTAWPE